MSSQNDTADKPLIEKTPFEGATVGNASVNIIKSGIGTGLLFMPYVFYQAGIILSIVFMAVMGVLCFYSWAVLCKVIRILENRGLTYQGQTKLTLDTAAGIVLGENHKLFAIISTLIFSYGSSVGYMVFIIQTMDDYVPHEIYTVAAVAAVYIPLSMFKSIEKLGVFSRIGIVALSSAIIVVLSYSTYKTSDHSFEGFTANYFDITQLPLYFGVFAFAYDINGVVTEVHASMQVKKKFTSVLFNYILFSFILGTILGVLGYLAFMDDVNSVIFKNFNDIGAFSPIICSFYSLSIVGNILLFGFPIVKIVDGFILKEKSNDVVRLILRIIFFVSIALLGLFVSGITNVFNLLGCIFSVILTFLIPMALVEKVKKMDRDGVNIKSVPLKSINGSSYVDQQSEGTYESNIESGIAAKPKQNNGDEEEEQLSQTKGNFILNISVVIIGLVGGVSGVVSSILDLID